MKVEFKQRRMRVGILTLALTGLFALVAMRLAMVVLVDGSRLNSMARSEHTAQMELAAVRGLGEFERALDERDVRRRQVMAEVSGEFRDFRHHRALA